MANPRAKASIYFSQSGGQEVQAQGAGRFGTGRLPSP